MNIKHDKEANAIYFKFRKSRFVKNIKLNEFIIIDLDDKENILGIEILDINEKEIKWKQ